MKIISLLISTLILLAFWYKDFFLTSRMNGAENLVPIRVEEDDEF